MNLSKEEKEILEDLETFTGGGNLSQERLERLGPYAMDKDALQDLRTRATQEEQEIQERVEDRETISVPSDTRAERSDFNESTIFANPGDRMYYVPGAEIGVDRFLQYISGFSDAKDVTQKGSTLGRKFWLQNVIPPLRMAISEIFKTSGAGQWRELSPFTRQLKHDPIPAETDDRKSKSVKVRDPKSPGGFRMERRGSYRIGMRPQSATLRVKKNIGDILFYRGKYRGALTKTRNFNTDGNLFKPLDGSWKHGFKFGIDQSWFNAFTRRTRGNPTVRGKSYDELEMDYPSKHETGGSAQFLYYWMVTKIKYKDNAGAGRSVTVKGKRTKRKRKEQIQDREQHKVVVTPAQARHLPKNIPIHLSKPAPLPARPVFSFFRTRHSIIDKFVSRVENNIAKNLGRYLDEGQRKQWYGEKDAQGLIPDKLGSIYSEGFRPVPESIKRRAGTREEMEQRLAQTSTGRQRYQELDRQLTSTGLSEAESQEFIRLQSQYDDDASDTADDDIGFDESYEFDDFN